MGEFSEIFLSHSLTMDSRREKILVLLSIFMVMKYVIVGILGFQKLAIFQQNVQMMVMAVFITQRRRVDFGRSCWCFQRYRGFLEQTLMGSFPERKFKRCHGREYVSQENAELLAATFTQSST